jgi:hypothetical protein
MKILKRSRAFHTTNKSTTIQNQHPKYASFKNFNIMLGGTQKIALVILVFSKYM